MQDPGQSETPRRDRRSPRVPASVREERKQVREERKQAIFTLRATGLTMQAIADQLGVSVTTVHRALCVTGDPCPHVFTGPKRCSIDGCERPSNYGPHGYCRMHQMREKRGIPLDAPLLRAPDGQRTPCIVKGCKRPRENKDGYCNGHARQLRDTGTVTPSFQPRMKQPEFCSFDGCTGKPQAKGYCAAHIRQLRLNGRMVPIRTIFDDCTYTGAHHRCRALWGRVQQYPCIECGDPAQEWAYDGTDPSELYDTRHDWQLRSIIPYSKFPEFYMPMCKRCHKKLDMERLQTELQQFRGWRKSQRQSFGDDDGPPPF
jgi:AraC-like DNA-binding protein